MGTTLTGKRVQNTYDSLLKLSDNDNLTGTPKIVGSGLGTNSPIYLSTTKVGIGMSPTVQFQTSGDAQIGNDLVVGGDLTVNGTTTFIDSTIVEIGDNMIELAKDNSANTKDIGWYGTINDGTEKYVGVFYDASSGTTTPEFKIGIGTSEPSSTATWTVKGKLVIGAIDSTGGTFSGQITIPETPTADGHAASKKYVDDSSNDATQTLAEVLTEGNTTGGTHIDVSAGDDINLTDTSEIHLGDSADLVIKHNGTQGVITNNTGTLQFVQNTDDGDIKFFCDDGSGGTENYLQIDGGEQRIKVFNDMRLNDNVELRLGTGNDSRIYHDSSNTIIDNNTGDLIIRCDSDDIKILAEDDILLRDNDDSTNFIHCVNGGAVKLYHNGSEKFVTTSSGINVTGNGIFSGDVKALRFEMNPDFAASNEYLIISKMQNQDGGIVMKSKPSGGSSQNDWQIINHSSTGDLRFYAYGLAGFALTLDRENGNATFVGSVSMNDLKIFDSNGSSTNRLKASYNGTSGVAIFGADSSGGNTELQIGTSNSGSYTTAITINSSQNTTFSGTIQAADGSAGNPSITFSGDTDTGIYRTSTNAINFGTNGSERMRITNTGLGIGTNSPSVKLDVRLSSTTGKVAEFHNSVGYGIGFSVESDGGVNTINSESNQALAFATNGASNERLRIDSSGNVGIGGTPNMKLNIHHADQDGLRFNCADGLETFIDFGDASDNDIGRISYDHADNHMAFRTNNAERMRITSGGSVGIGTTNPSQNLHVVGSIYASGVGSTLLFDTTGALGSNGIKTINDYETLIFNGRGAAGFAVIGNSNIRLGFGTNYTNAETDLYIDTSGRVGIGTASPNEKLHVAGNIHAYDTSADRALFASNASGSTTIAIRSNGITHFNGGNVGIGTASPVATYDKVLHVKGTNPTIRIETDNSSGWAYHQFVSPESTWSVGIDAAEIMTWANHTTLGSGHTKMVLTKDGHLGIGTNSPTNILHTSTSSNAVARFESTDGVAYIRINDTSDSLYISTESQIGSIGGNTGANNGNLNINLTNGFVGIGGTTSPDSKLQIMNNDGSSYRFGYGGSSDVYFDADNIYIRTDNGGANTATFTTTGLGIGTTSPSDALEIYGATKGIIINNTAETDAGIMFRDSADPGQQASIKYGSGDNDLNFFNGDSTTIRFRIDNTGDAHLAKYLRHQGDTNSYLGWSGGDDFRIVTGGRELVRLDEGTDPDIAKFMTDEFRMYSNGDFHADGDVIAYSTTTSSDKRFKKDIKPIENALDIVKKLQGVHFNWKENDEKSIGYIAQDVEKVLPEMVKEKNHFDKGEFKTVNYAAMVSIMSEAIKELNAKVEALENKCNCNCK